MTCSQSVNQICVHSLQTRYCTQKAANLDGRAGFCCSGLLGFALVGHRLHRCGNGVGIAQIVAANRFEVFVQFVDQRLSGRDVQIDDVVVADAIQMFDQGPLAVAMRRDYHFLT